ncbi:MAG TPA: hypothetical protein VGE01_02935 [Fimbriimonas sp.]
MANTIYAAFNDASLAEKAAGALLDHGVRSEDISVVRGQTEGMATIDTTHPSGTTVYGRTDGDNDLKNAGDAAVGGVQSGVERVQEWGDRAAGGVADALGQEGTAARYRAAADRQDLKADERAAAAGREMSDAVDMDSTSTAHTIDNPGGFSGGRALGEIAEEDARVSNENVGYGTTADRLDRVNDPDYQAHVRDRDDADHTEDQAKHGISTTTGADAGAGAIKGTAVGIGVGALAALASLFVPGVGLVLGGGALAAALGGVAASAGAGAAAGAVTGYLKDQGVDEHIASDYDAAVRNGGALLAVNAPSGDCDEMRIREILDKYGATNVNAYTGRGYVA